MNILTLVGSADINSHSLHLGYAIRDEIKELGHNVVLINLIDYDLPNYNRVIERDNAYDENTLSFLKLSSGMDAFVWITPIYHNSYSSTLKNALDWHHATKFPGKVVGLASNGGNRSPQAADQLTLVARSQHMITIPTRVCTQESDYDENLNICDENIKQRIKKFATELVDITHKLQN